MQKLALATALAMSSILSLPVHAEAQFGYNSAGAAPAVTATAKLSVSVVVPKLILLRVGSTGNTVDTATLTAKFNPDGIPGDPGALSTGSNQGTIWDGTAPVWATTSSSAVRAYAWTNAKGGADITPAVTTDFAGDGAGLAGLIKVDSTTVAGAGLTHPALMSGTTAMHAAQSTLEASDWVFKLDNAALQTVNPGTFSAQMTYTATSL